MCVLLWLMFGPIISLQRSIETQCIKVSHPSLSLSLSLSYFVFFESNTFFAHCSEEQEEPNVPKDNQPVDRWFVWLMRNG